MFIDCYKWDNSNALQLHRKLINEHLYPSYQSKMRNHLADEVLNSKMLHLMIQYEHYLGEKRKELDGAIELLKHTSKAISIFRDLRPIKTTEDPRLLQPLDISHRFENWKNNAMPNTSIKSKERAKLIMFFSSVMKIFSLVLLVS